MFASCTTIFKIQPILIRTKHSAHLITLTRFRKALDRLWNFFEPEYRDILRSLGVSKLTIFWKIALPKTLPEFFGALKVAVTLAFIGTNLMEIVSPHGRGLGALFDSGKTNSDYPLMFAVLIALAVLGIALYNVVVFLEKIFAGWAERSTD